MYPSRVTLFLLIPLYIGCSAFGPEDYALYKQHHVFLTGDRFWLGLAGLVAFTVSSFCAELGVQRSPIPLRVDGRDLRIILAGLYVVTLLAYAIFLFPVLLNPRLVVELYNGSTTAAGGLRGELQRIPGVTTLDTLQSLCVVLHIVYGRLTGNRLPYVYWFLLVALTIACLLRAWLWSERLALIELVIPATLAAIGYPGKRRKLLLAASPVLGLLVVFGLFCAGEYFRSWQFYRAGWHDSFVAFAWARFVGYYATALNNGALLYSTIEHGYLPFYTADWFYRLPFWELLRVGFQPSGDVTMALLNSYANPEFNNESGLFLPFIDFGSVGGILCWATLGIVSGLLLRSFSNLQLFGVILFPVWYVGVLEIQRVFYWGASRFFPVLVLACVISIYLERRAVQSRRFKAARLLLS